MAYELFVEICADLAPELRTRLVAGAYRASRSSRIALVLKDVSREDVDRVLDPVVRKEGIAVAGVRYLSPDEARTRLHGNGADPCVVVSREPDWLNGASSGTGVRVESPEQGLRSMEGS